MKEDCIAVTKILAPKHLKSFSDSARIFQNKELLTITDREKKFPVSRLINKLNHLNFIDGGISVIFDHQQNGSMLVINAYPQPCIKDELTCLLALDDPNPDLTDYNPCFLMIDDGLAVMIASIKLLRLEKSSLTVMLPDEGLIKTTRKTKRHRCIDIACEIIQTDGSHRGLLVDYTPIAFSIRLSEERAFSPEETATINLFQGSTVFFSGTCRIKRSGIHMPDGKVVYEPVDEEMRIFPQKKSRNPREQNAASFQVSFQHPFFRERIVRNIFDVSASGFSIREDFAEQTLMTGMIIPELSIIYEGIAEMKCSAQVVYHRDEKEHPIVQSGTAITDMDVRSYSRLNHIVGSHLDINAHVSTNVDMESLWEFFFDTGFIYGEKYQHLYPYRNTFRETYRKLYQDNPDIARHFTYEKNGKIYGHIAMIHAYEPSWVIHHYSAKPMEAKVPGMLVLRQIIHFLNGSYRFRSFGLNYVMTYYRPDNRIVDKIFGGFARELNDPKGSSLDLFSYLHFDRKSCQRAIPPDFLVRPCTPDDFKALETFYEKASGGILLESFGLDLSSGNLEEKFRQAGFKRNYQTFCLCRENRHVAFLIINQSDLGLNLSDLLNGIKIFIVDETSIRWDDLLSVLHELSQTYDTDQIPILVYPDTYLPKQGINVGKQYQLWIMKTSSCADKYTEYMRLKFRIRYETATKS